MYAYEKQVWSRERPDTNENLFYANTFFKRMAETMMYAYEKQVWSRERPNTNEYLFIVRASGLFSPVSHSVKRVRG